MPLEERSELMQQILQITDSREDALIEAVRIGEMQKRRIRHLEDENLRLVENNTNQKRLIDKLMKGVIPELKAERDALEKELAELTKELRILDFIRDADVQMARGEMEWKDERENDSH